LMRYPAPDNVVLQNWVEVRLHTLLINQPQRTQVVWIFLQI
jgi:hypothetical protein